MLAHVYFIMNQTAEVSDVYSITEINLELHINHTSNISNNIYTHHMYPMFSQISHIHSHVLQQIAEAMPCFCLVFTTRRVGEMALEKDGNRFNHDVGRT